MTQHSAATQNMLIFIVVFKYWYKNSYPGGQIPSNRAFVNKISKHCSYYKNIHVEGKNIKLIDDYNNEYEHDQLYIYIFEKRISLNFYF